MTEEKELLNKFAQHVSTVHTVTVSASCVVVVVGQCVPH